MNVRPFFEPFPVIDLGEILLREISYRDASNYLNYMGNKQMEEFLTVDNIPQSMEAALEEVNYWGGLFPGKKSIYWAIALKETDEMIGTAGFNVISFTNSRAEISYDLNPKYWNNGIMLKSIKSILRYADSHLELIRIQATVIIDNFRSIKLLERCGFRQEGYLQKYEVVNGELKDYYMYARVAF